MENVEKTLPNQKTLINKELTTWRMILYGIGDIYGGGCFVLIGILLLNYFTDIVHISPFMAGLIITIGRVWDAISDPLMGMISDRTKSRFGRRRVYFLIGLLPIFITFAALWFPVRFESEAGTVLYYMVLYLLFNSIITMVMVPYNALMPELTPDFQQRGRLSGIRIAFSNFSGIIGGILPTAVISWGASMYSDQTDYGYMVMGVSFGLFYTLPFVGVFLGTKEPKEVVIPKSQRNVVAQFFYNVYDTMKNRSYRLQIGMYLAAFIAIDVLMAMFIYFMDRYIGIGKEMVEVIPGVQMELKTYMLGFMLISQILALPIHVYVGNRLGKHMPYIIGIIIWATCMFTTFALDATTPLWGMLLLSAVIGVGMSGAGYSPWSIIADIPDVDEMITGSRREGVYAGYMTFIRKLTFSIAVLIIGFVLDQVGYEGEKEQQSELALKGIQYLFAIGPTALMFVGFIIAIRFPITPQRHLILRQEIARLKEGGKPEDVTAETRQVCELLTGYKYEDLWKGEVPK